MNFVSWAFVLLFVPIFVARNIIGRNKTERAFIALTLVASTIFVIWHIPIYILVMLTSIGVDFIAAKYIFSAPQGSHRAKVMLAASMTANLALLGFFKYGNFALRTVEHVFAIAHKPVKLPEIALPLPMGISFYTFGSMSYTIDVYRRRIKPVQRFKDFYYFVTFFPHLVAGPIIRAEQFFYQMPRRRRLHLRLFNEGIYQIIRGLFLKMVIADNIATVLNPRWPRAATAAGNAPTSAMLMVLFAAQIFCDFEGYSSIARGLAYLMGYRFPINFNYPYIASSFSNFWERWHITLSQWLRDYLYIPLGGNRISTARTYANLLIVMLLGGLWHGAAWTFIVWGAIHGTALAIERALGLARAGRITGLPRLLWYVVVQVIVMIAWVFFRSRSVPEAAKFLGSLRHFHGHIEPDIQRVSLALIPVFVMHLHAFLVEQKWIPALTRVQKAVIAGGLVCATLVFYGTSSDFIYFQF